MDVKMMSLDWDVTSWKEADPSIGGYTQPYPYTCCTIENEPSLKNIKDGYVSHHCITLYNQIKMFYFHRNQYYSSRDLYL